MTTKDFTKMTTKKLNALIETASDEDKAAIQAVLDARAQNEKPATQGQAEGQEYNDPDYTPTEEDEKAWAESEANNGKPAKVVRRSESELVAILEECKANINHKCQVMPFNNPEWVEGVIIGARIEKRAAQVFYAIKLNDGKSMVKAYNSNLLKVLDEVVEREGRKRAPKASREPMTDEAIALKVKELYPNVGKMVTLEDGTTGRIISIVPDKRVSMILYRISVPTPTEVDPGLTKTVHRVSTAAITIEETFDEVGAELNEKFIARREKAYTKETLSPEQKLTAAKEAVAKAEEALKKAQETLEARKANLEKAEADYQAYLDSLNESLE